MASIADRAVGPGEPVYVVAEMSANHARDLDTAKRTVRAAAHAGADAIKLQTYTPDTMTLDCDAEPFRAGEGTIWEGRRLYDLYAEAAMPWEWQPELKRVADGCGIHLFSSPFDETAVDFLEEMDVPAYKIASFEIVDLPLLRRVAAAGKPVLVSTGMASAEEIEEALKTLREGGAGDVILLKCTSAYPAPYDAMNLRTIPDMAARFRTPVGLSDHTLGTAVPVAAVALGACLVEKHFTLSRGLGGPDATFSVEPDELAALVEAVRAAEQALGGVSYGRTERERASAVFRRSLFVAEDVARGEPLTRANVRCIRPGHGLAPRHLDEVLGRRAARDLSRGTPLAWEDLA